MVVDNIASNLNTNNSNNMNNMNINMNLSDSAPSSNKQIIVSSDLEMKSPPPVMARMKSSSKAASFKKDISAKFIDIHSMDRKSHFYHFLRQDCHALLTFLLLSSTLLFSSSRPLQIVMLPPMGRS
jgi:hypothetical protein